MRNDAVVFTCFVIVLYPFFTRVNSRFVRKVNLECLMKMIIVIVMNFVSKYKELELFDYFYDMDTFLLLLN